MWSFDSLQKHADFFWYFGTIVPESFLERWWQAPGHFLLGGNSELQLCAVEPSGTSMVNPRPMKFWPRRTHFLGISSGNTHSKRYNLLANWLINQLVNIEAWVQNHTLGHLTPLVAKRYSPPRYVDVQLCQNLFVPLVIRRGTQTGFLADFLS